MDNFDRLFPKCPHHGLPRNRQTCRACNAAYMRGYLRRRRYNTPAKSLWDRARKRANVSGIAFSLEKNSIVVPRTCPALGIAIELRAKRSACSPSLDRVIPDRGYVPGNVRVICDRANRLKGSRNLQDLRRLAECGPVGSRREYAMVATYVEREQLLAEIRQKAAVGGRAGQEWAKIADFLDRIFRKSLVKLE